MKPEVERPTRETIIDVDSMLVDGRTELWRQDDNGNRARMQSHESRALAQLELLRFEHRGHKQYYYLV